MSTCDYVPEDGRWRTLVLRDERGFLEYRLAPGNVCEIVDIETYPEHRRTGVGRRLVNCLINDVLAREDGKVVTLYAVTRTSNLIAQQFYEELGFRVVAVLRNFYKDGGKTVDAIMYGRDL